MGIATHSVSELDIAEQESPWSPSNSQRKGSLLALQGAAAAQTSLLAVQKVRKPSACFMAQLRKAFFIFRRMVQKMEDAAIDLLSIAESSVRK